MASSSSASSRKEDRPTNLSSGGEAQAVGKGRAHKLVKTLEKVFDGVSKTISTTPFPAIQDVLSDDDSGDTIKDNSQENRAAQECFRAFMSEMKPEMEAQWKAEVDAILKEEEVLEKLADLDAKVEREKTDPSRKWHPSGDAKEDMRPHTVQAKIQHLQHLKEAVGEEEARKDNLEKRVVSGREAVADLVKRAHAGKKATKK